MKKIYFIVLTSLFSCQMYCAQGALRRVEVAGIDKLQRALRQYCDNDAHLKELYDVLTTQKTQLDEYNNIIDAPESLNQEQQAIVNKPSFQDLIQISNIEVESLSQLSSVIMQSKNIDPSWQIQKYGPIFGSISFMRNLFVPKDVQSYVYAGVGAVTGLTVFKNMQKASPTIQINVPQGVTNITIKDDSQQKLAATVAVCALGAGGVVAGTQLFNSWMYEKNSRDALTDKIRAIKNSNAQIGAAFGTIGLHKVLARQEQAIGVVDNRVVQVQAGVDAVNYGVNQLQQGAVRDRQVNADRHDLVSNQFIAVNEKIDKIIFDQKKFEKSVTNLFTESDKKSNARHANLQQEVKNIKDDVAQFRNESAAAYNNLDTKLTDVQQGIAQGQSRLESLIISGQSSNSRQLTYGYSKYPVFGGVGALPHVQLQNSASSHVGTGSSFEEVE